MRARLARVLRAVAGWIEPQLASDDSSAAEPKPAPVVDLAELEFIDPHGDDPKLGPQTRKARALVRAMREEHVNALIRRALRSATAGSAG
jgi:hypothetical protein